MSDAFILNDRTTTAALAEKYDAIAYAARSNALSHPAHMSAVATLCGMRPAPVATCRVLELGCSDGTNLLPMAAAFRDARFVGCDVSSRAIASAGAAAAELGLDNVTFLHQDFSALAENLGTFDYIIAHGIYSWVPPAVRDALFDVAFNRLSEQGVMFVSYNVYPGCRVRQAAWEALHFHVDGIADPRARMDVAREFAGLLAEAGMTQEKSDALMRDEFRRIAQQPDSALFHDDLAEPNEPVYFHQFAAHAARHGLTFLAEAKLLMMSSAALAPRVQQFVANMDLLAREQYLDFARVRRFRQSLLCRGAFDDAVKLSAEHVQSMHVCASGTLARAAAEGKAFVTEPTDAPAGAITEAALLRPMLKWLLERFPESASPQEVAAWITRFRGARALAPGFSVESMLLDACIVGTVELYVEALAINATAGQRPLATASARWQARHGAGVTNLRHETMTLQDSGALALLALLDGRQSRSALAAAMRSTFGGVGATEAAARVDEYLHQFARYALLMPEQTTHR
jgi:protein-L-isoaspartate O-methyltransferase